MRKMRKSALLAMLGGSLFFAGCLGEYVGYAIQQLPGSIFAEFLTDNPDIWDVFPDGPAQ